MITCKFSELKYGAKFYFTDEEHDTPEKMKQGGYAELLQKINCGDKRLPNLVGKMDRIPCLISVESHELLCYFEGQDRLVVPILDNIVGNNDPLK